MQRDADNPIDVQWLARCADRLRQQRPRADVMSIEEVAIELWDTERWSELSGEEAVEIWLQPLHGSCGTCGGSC